MIIIIQRKILSVEAVVNTYTHNAHIHADTRTHSSVFSAAERWQRPCGTLGTGSRGRPPRLSHSSPSSDTSIIIECMSFGSFSLRGITCMHCVYLALWTRKVLCGSFFLCAIYKFSFIHSLCTIYSRLKQGLEAEEDSSAYAWSWQKEDGKSGRFLF